MHELRRNHDGNGLALPEPGVPDDEETRQTVNEPTITELIKTYYSPSPSDHESGLRAVDSAAYERGKGDALRMREERDHYRDKYHEQVALTGAAYERGLADSTHSRAAILSELKAVIDEAGLRELEAKASPAPWVHGVDESPPDEAIEGASGGTIAFMHPHANVRTVMRHGESFDHGSARLIVALRNTLPKLLALVPAEAGGKEKTDG